MAERWGISLRKGGRGKRALRGREVGRYGPFTASVARQQAQALADGGTLAPGVRVVLAPWGQIAPTRRRRANPDDRQGCRDSRGNFIPTPACGGGPSPSPTQRATFRIAGKDRSLRLAARFSSSNMAGAKRLKNKIRDRFKYVRIKSFEMGIGVYVYGRELKK